MIKPWLTLIALMPALAWAQDGDAPNTAAVAPSPPPACAGADYRQFDFWIGEWSVTTGGQPAGKNRIEAVHQGCALAEHWTSANGGFSGSSLNTFDAATGRWHQSWVDSSGTLLLLDGGLVDGSMVLEGTRPAPNGVVEHRISWTPNADGSVRQQWDTRQGGGDWTSQFDGLYRRVETP